MDVVDGDNGPLESRIGLDFTDYAITGRRRARVPFAEGQGFSVALTSPDVGLGTPFSSVDVVIDLPEARIPDVAPYNDLLPDGIGFSLVDGSGRAHGRIEASSLDGHAHGDLFVSGSQVKATLDDLDMVGDIAVHAKLDDGDISEGTYDISGSSMHVSGVELVDRAHPGEYDTHGWDLDLAVTSGSAHVGAPIYLTTDLAMTCSDSVPFVTIFAEKKSLPDWARNLMAVPTVRGSGHVSLGTDLVHFRDGAFESGNYELLVQLLRKGPSNKGTLYARFGKLAIGVALDGKDRQIRWVGARSWYDEQPPLR
jgi:translocation and assembly module TamB